VNAIKAHPFYRDLVAVQQHGQLAGLTAAQLRAASQDALRMRVGWAIVWKPATAGAAIGYLRRTGFTFVRQVHGAELFRLIPVPVRHQ
jgi:hypothetical protein